MRDDFLKCGKCLFQNMEKVCVFRMAKLYQPRRTLRNYIKGKPVSVLRATGRGNEMRDIVLRGNSRAGRSQMRILTHSGRGMRLQRAVSRA